MCISTYLVEANMSSQQVFELETKMLINASLYGNAIRGALPPQHP